MNNNAFPEFKIESTALRDALLPKLISGEIPVKDAERFLEERDYDG